MPGHALVGDQLRVLDPPRPRRIRVCYTVVEHRPRQSQLAYCAALVAEQRERPTTARVEQRSDAAGQSVGIQHVVCDSQRLRERRENGVTPTRRTSVWVL